jgi:Fic family protein
MSTTPPYQLYTTREQKADLEARNGLLLFSAIEKMVGPAKAGFSLNAELLCELHRLVIQDIYTCSGCFRKVNVGIMNTRHVPPPWQKVEGFVDEMCSYVNDNFGKSAIHLAAYLMWRHNWIHPFAGGNGRTSRGVSYLVLCVRLGFVLPGKNTIPQQIVKSRDPYYEALQAADEAARDGRLDVSQMEELLSNMLAAQLLSVHSQARSE